MKRALILLCVFMAFFGIFSNCKKELDVDPTVNNNNNNNPNDTTLFVVEGVKVTNGTVTERGFTHVIIKADFSAFTLQTFTVVDYGHVVSKSNSLPDLDNNNGLSSLGERDSKGQFTSEIDSLEPGTTYYARVYLKRRDNATGTITPGYHPYSISFTTLNPEPPDVIDTVKNVLSSSFLIEGKIVDFKGTDILNHGFIWSTTHASDTSLIFTKNEGKYEQGAIDQAESHSFSHTIPNLEGGTTYFARAFAQNQFGYGYGEIMQVTTLDSPMPLIVIDSIFLVSDANNTGQPNPGESVTYNVILKNIGETTAENVDVNFFSNDAIITSSQPVTYGSIVPSGTKSRQVQLQISNSVSAGDAIQVVSEINGDNLPGTTDNATFTLTIAAAPTPEIEIESITLVADANNTGQPNPGELVTYNVTLKNIGDVAAENVDVTFLSNDITVMTSQPVSFGTIVQNGTKSKQVQFEISTAVSPGDIIQISSQISGDNFQTTTDNSTFSFTIAAPPAPNISLVSVVVTEPNGTGNVNPGEEVTLTITLKNTGDADASGVSLTVGASPHYSILTPSVDFGAILPNQQKAKDVIIQIGSSVPWNTAVAVPFYVSDDIGTNWTFSPGASFTVVSPYVVTDGLGFYVRFNECSGNNVSSSVGSNVGELFGAQFSSDILPGVSGCSMNFNAQSQQYIQFPSNPLNGYANASVSFWMKTLSGSTTLFSIVSNPNSENLKLYNNKFQAGYFGVHGSFDFDVTIYLDNNWHHFVLVADDAGQSKLYIDGAFKYAKSKQFNVTSSTGLYFGRTTASSSYFNGQMDNVRIYNRALSAAEVQQIYNAKQ